MRFKYSNTHPDQDALDSMPRLPLLLQNGAHALEVAALIDSGAMVNVLPYSVGLKLGLVWDNRKANLRLAGNLERSLAMPVLVVGKLEKFPPSRLVFAWLPHDDAALILGQTNFFAEYEICFFRASMEFEVKPKM